MDNNEAIELLTKQKEKIKALNEQTYITWKSQTAWIIEQLYGKESDMYKRIEYFKFYNHYSDISTNQQIKNNSHEATHLIEAAIEMVKFRVIPKEQPKLNIIYRISDTLDITLKVYHHYGTKFTTRRELLMVV